MPQLFVSSVATPIGLATWRPTTAQLVREVSSNRQAEAVPAGIAIHHFTDLFDERTDVSLAELHRATTVLTKQVEQALLGQRALDRIQKLVVDPQRIATPDGRSASEFCGAHWPQFIEVAGGRAEAAVEGADRFGQSTVMQLAALRTASATQAWWGTTEWANRVDAWTRSVWFRPKLKHTVRTSPELLDDDLLLDLIGR